MYVASRAARMRMECCSFRDQGFSCVTFRLASSVSTFILSILALALFFTGQVVRVSVSVFVSLPGGLGGCHGVSALAGGGGGGVPGGQGRVDSAACRMERASVVVQ